MFLIRLGHVWDERNADGTRRGSWTRAHWRWISGIRLEGPQRDARASGFEAACEAALRVVEGGRVPDDATVDVLARRIEGGGGEAGGADLSVYDGFLKGAVADGR